MPVEVLLMADIKDIGSEGEVVRVAEGYARNYLLPRKLAAPVTEATRRRLAKLQKERESAKVAERAKARALVAEIGKESFTVRVKTGAEGKMFGSVTPGDLVDVLKKQGIEIDKHQVLLEEPLKETGVYEVKIRLHPEVDATMKVWIVEE